MKTDSLHLVDFGAESQGIMSKLGEKPDKTSGNHKNSEYSSKNTIREIDQNFFYEFQNIQKQNEKLINENAKLKDELKQFNEEHVNMEKFCQEMSEKQRKSRKKYKMLKREFSEMNQSHVSTIQHLNNMNSTLSKKVVEAQALLKESKILECDIRVYDQLEKDLVSKDVCINDLRAQLEAQYQEIQELAFERSSILGSLYQMSQVVTLDQEFSEINVPKTTALSNNVDYLTVTIPFEGSIYNECQDVLTTPGLSPAKTIDSLFLVMRKHYDYLENKVFAFEQDLKSKEKSISEIIRKNSSLASIYITFYKKLSENAEIELFNDHPLKEYLYDELNLVQRELSQTIVEGLSLLNTKFFNTSDPIEQMKMISTIVSDQESLSILSCVLSLLKLYRDQSRIFIEEQSKLIVLSDEKQTLDNENVNLKSKISRLIPELKQSKKYISEISAKIADYENMIESLKREINGLKAKEATLNNSIAFCNPEKEEYEIIIETKTKECKDLNNHIVYLREQIEKICSDHTKEIEKLDSEFQKRVSDLRSEIAEKNNVNQILQKSYKKKLNEKKQEYNDKLQNIEGVYKEKIFSLNESIAYHEQTITKMQEKHRTEKMDSERMIENSKSETKKLISEINSLQNIISRCKIQCQKEKEELQTNIKVQLLAADSRKQEEISRVKSAFQKRIDSIIQTANIIGEFYNCQITENELPQLLTKAKSDLERLKKLRIEFIQAGKN